MPENNRRLRYLTREEADRLIKACYETPKCHHLAPIVITALQTGMRRGEILRLKWDNVDFKNGYIYVEDSKNKTSRLIPMSQTLRQTLSNLPRHLSSPYVFWHDNGKPYDDIKHSFNKVLKRAGIKVFTFHDLRHTFASHLVMNGVDLMTVKELLGHKDIKMTMRYSHLSPDHKRVAVKRIEAVLRRETKVIELPLT